MIDWVLILTRSRLDATRPTWSAGWGTQTPATLAEIVNNAGRLDEIESAARGSP